MAVSKLWPVTVRLATVLDYASNPEKTTKSKSKYSDADYQALRDVVAYAKDGEKTERELFCEGIHCNPQTAREQFITVKEQFGKPDGIQAYHGYLSFEETDITPELAQQVGMAFAERMWGDRFQVLVTTHLNTEHLHCHFVVNSVSFRDGKRFVSDNWVVQNLENALETWNEKLAEIWQLITTTPQDFKGGGIWGVIVNINGAVQSIGLALLVLFFVAGMVKTCGSFTEVKKPEHALKLFVRFAIAKGAITYGMELMLALFNIVQGTISTIMGSAGFSTPQQTVLPPELITSIEECGFFESIPLWAVTLIGGLFITVMSFILIMTVYGRFFKLYMYTALAPIPLSTFAGEPSQNVGKSFIKSYCAVCLEGAVIVLSCIIFSLFASSPPVVNPDAAAVTQVWSYIGELLFNMLVLVGSVKMSDRIIREMMGL